MVITPRSRSGAVAKPRTLNSEGGLASLREKENPRMTQGVFEGELGSFIVHHATSREWLFFHA